METLPSLVLGNVTLPSGRVADITLENGMVAHVGARSGSTGILDCRGLLVLPAAIDMHVHMRGGVQSAKEDWKSGSMSALAGGVTVVVDQPNTIPPITTPESLQARVRDARKNAYCSFAINSGVNPDTPLESMWQAGAMAFGETFCAPSSYGDAVSGTVLRRALERIHALGALATIHAETVGPGEDTDLVSHDRVRSPEGELLAVEAAGQANTTGCRLHFCHLSTRRSIDAAPGSVEVTPHHLFLSREDFDAGDPFGKVNPPLRSEKERKHLWGAWNRIDVIASDHAPHTREEKAQPFPVAPSGICGVETMVPLLLPLVIDGKISLQSVIRKTSSRPAEILGLPPAGFRPGDRADFALYGKIRVPVQAEMLHSRCGWTPFEGHMAIFPATVIRGGRVVYREGEFVREEPAWFPGRGFRGTH
jgi:dihydroorotase